jgi:flavin-dependent dehydrogenase
VPPLKQKVTIAGGGLAGLSLAVGLARRGVPVEVLEASRYPRHRVCGEFISGVEVDTLRELGIEVVFNDVRLHHTLAWFDKGKEIHRGTLPHPALGISRHRLDLRLKELVESSGGTVQEGVRATRENREGEVWAAGRIATASPWIGLKCHFRELPMRADLEMHQGPTGYAGLAGIEEGRVNVCGLFKVDRSIKGHGVELLFAYLRRCGLDQLGMRLKDADHDENSFTGVSAFALGWQPNRERGLSIGDAAAMIPPFTGNGMSMAFQSAAMALDPLDAWSSGQLSWDECVLQIHLAQKKRFSRRLKAAGTMQSMLEQPWGRGALRVLGETKLLPFRSLLSLVR